MLAQPSAMSGNTQSRLRRSLPNTKSGILHAAQSFFGQQDVWTKILVCAAATISLYIFTFGWSPAFPYRTRKAPLRDVYAKANFKFEDKQATDEARNRARRNINCFYEHDRQMLVDLRKQLIEDIFAVRDELNEDVRSNSWTKFLGDTDNQAMDPNDPMSDLSLFREALEQDNTLENLREVIDKAFIEIDENGLLTKLDHELEQGSLSDIKVYDKGNPESARLVSVSKVRIAEISDQLKQNIKNELQSKSDIITNPTIVSDRIFDWLLPQLPTTLKLDEKKSERERGNAAAAVERVWKNYKPGDPLDKQLDDVDRLVIRGGVPLDEDDILILREEHRAMVQSMTLPQHLGHSALFLGTFFVIFSLLASYLVNRDRRLLDDVRHFIILVTLTSVTFLVGWLVALIVDWRAEAIPFVMFAMIIAIAYNTELAIFLSSLISLAFTITHGYGIPEFVILGASTCLAAMFCDKIRSRTKLVYVGLATAAIIFPIVIGIHSLMGQPVSYELLLDGVWYCGSAGLAGLFMTALLPFLEQWFDIQTDISLLELSDANHPLLRQLVQQAPGTYNHSINVASISEAAAEAVGANGLLCRVGAYFHDIGKTLKPEYFIENQGGGENKHDDLEPTMSTIVIVAHVKDGAEMARLHKMPQKIIDMIEQHHGTTVVEYFYNRAVQQCESEEDANAVEKDAFRYPGPKPQTPEAAIMMIADSVESASRALREPAPARIENLVTEITKKKLNDGQLDECSITLQQLHTVQESMIKSLNAMYHGRVKYPEPSNEKATPEKQTA